MPRFSALAAGLLALLLTFESAYADSPHFVQASASTSGPNLVISFKEAGLGSNQNVTEVASADATATYACINNGGKNPSAANKKDVAGPVSASGQFSSGKNGQITGSLTINPPGAGGFSCPNGQTLELARVTYTNAKITDTTNGVFRLISGTFCVSLDRRLFPC